MAESFQTVSEGAFPEVTELSVRAYAPTGTTQR